MHNGRADLLFFTTDRNGAGQSSFVDGGGDLTALVIFQLVKARPFGFIIICVRPSVRLVLSTAASNQVAC
jgi:hypothetical protein